MYVVSKRNIILPGPNGEKFRMEKDYMGLVPAWAENSAYLKALAADGKVIISLTGTDRNFSKKEKKPKKLKEPAKDPEEETKEKAPKEENQEKNVDE